MANIAFQQKQKKKRIAGFLCKILRSKTTIQQENRKKLTAPVRQQQKIASNI